LRPHPLRLPPGDRVSPPGLPGRPGGDDRGLAQGVLGSGGPGLRHQAGLPGRAPAPAGAPGRRGARGDMELGGRGACPLAGQAEAFHRARQDITEPPSVVGVSHEPDGLVAALARSRGHLDQGLSRLAGDRDPTVPLPFASLPASVATFVLVIEYGFHLNDLEWALGEATELSTDVARTMVELLAIWLPSLQGDKPDGPVGYRLAGDGGV